MSSLYNDGSSGASSGAAQLPDLLAGYATRPAWEVAGVDYAVGVPDGTSLKDPATIAMAGVSVDTGNHIVYVTGSNVTLNGYDFGLAGGYSVVVESGTTNTVVKNSNFLVGSNDQVPIDAGVGVGNLTVQNCTIDGGGRTDGNVYALVVYNGSGTLTAQYNVLRNAPADAIDFSAGRLTFVVTNNLIENLGSAPGAHADSIQSYSDNASNSVFDYNTVYQPNPSGMQGIQLDAQGGSTISNTQIENNVVLAKGPSLEMSYSIAVGQASGSVVQGVTVANNYIDASGAYGPFYPPNGSNLTFSNNVNLSTGAVYANPPGTSPGAPSGPPSLTWSAGPVSGTEGTAIALGALSENLNGGTAQSLVISGIPAGAVLTDGAHSFTASPGGGSVDVSAWNLAALRVTPATDTDFSLTATATTQGSGAGTAKASEQVTVGPLAPGVSWAASVSGVAGTATDLGTLATSMKGLPGDSNSLQSVTISGVPTGDVLGDGTHAFTATASSNAVSVMGWNMANLEIDAPVAAQATLTATAVARDAQGATSSASAGEAVTIAAPPSGSPPPAPTDPYNDGAAGASPGPAQLPGLLSGYSTRPAWQVAGVNYAVGAPAGLALRDPTLTGNLPSGTWIDAANHMVHVDGNNVTLNGYDFGLHGGWGVTIDSGTSGTTVISNSNFSMGAGEPIAINAQSTNVGNLTVTNDTFNGNRANIPSVRPPPSGTGLGSAINYDGNGSFTAEHNYLYGLPGDGMDFSDGTVTPTIKYNLFAGIGYTPGAHPDPVQFYADQVNNAVIAFNTIYTPQSSNLTENEGLQVEAQGGSTITNTTIENNTIIATGPRMVQSLNVAVWQDPGNTINGVVVANNYLDPTATYEAFGSGVSTPQGSNLTFTGNQNLLIGTALGSPSGTRPSDVTGVSASPATGTLGAGAAVTLTLMMDQAETVTGTPTLALNDGGTATYASGSGSNALRFNYTVGAGDKAVPTLAVTGVGGPAGAAIRDAGGSLQNLSGALVSLPGLGIAPGSGGPPASDTLVLNLSEDAYLGNAQFLVSVDGKTLGPAQQVTALHASGQSEAFSYIGNYGAGTHDVRVSFINDAYAGRGYDRNLYVNSIDYNGAAVPNSSAPLYRTGSADFAVGLGSTTATAEGPAPAGSGDDTLVLNLAEDSYQGDATFIAYVDGKGLGPAQSVTASHAAGGMEAFTFHGAFGSGPHSVEIDFLNDAYAGPGYDRNLYVDSISFDSQAYSGDKSSMYVTGGTKFAVAAGDTLGNRMLNTAVSTPLHS